MTDMLIYWELLQVAKMFVPVDTSTGDGKCKGKPSALFLFLSEYLCFPHKET